VNGVCPELLKEEDRWDKEDIQNDWNYKVIVQLPKKSDIGDCINWHGTTLLSLIDKAFSPIILQG